MQDQPQNSKTILLLEDDKAFNHAIMLKLKQKGHRVISTTRAEDALAILNAKHPDIFIIWLDLLLPGMSGMEFLASLRKNEEFKKLKVVICSVSGNEESRGIARNLGAVDFLIKSDYSLDALADKVLSYT